MIPPGLLNGFLWTGLILLLISTIAGGGRLGFIGWAMFGIYWLGEPFYYMQTGDYFNVFVVLGAAAFCFYLSWLMFRGVHRYVSLWASRAAAISGLLYFPFAMMEPLRDWLIGVTAALTVWVLNAIGVGASMAAWNIILLNGRTVEIILACTAIESIALFAGVILSVDAPGRRRLAALVLSTASIYSLNLIRNGFVLVAYAHTWFGDDSFYIAHNVIAKAGSTIALLAIAYMVFTILPELVHTIDLLMGQFRRHGGDAA